MVYNSICIFRKRKLGVAQLEEMFSHDFLESEKQKLPRFFLLKILAASF